MFHVRPSDALKRWVNWSIFFQQFLSF